MWQLAQASGQRRCRACQALRAHACVRGRSCRFVGCGWRRGVARAWQREVDRLVRALLVVDALERGAVFGDRLPVVDDRWIRRVRAARDRGDHASGTFEATTGPMSNRPGLATRTIAIAKEGAHDKSMIDWCAAPEQSSS
jgi:hypothetical protein